MGVLKRTDPAATQQLGLERGEEALDPRSKYASHFRETSAALAHALAFPCAWFAIDVSCCSFLGADDTANQT